MEAETKLAKKEQRDRRLVQIMALPNEGYTVDEKTPYQFRINGRLDLYPTWAKWHDIKTGKRGKFKGHSVREFVNQFFRNAA